MGTPMEELRVRLDELDVAWWQRKCHTCWKVEKKQGTEHWRAWLAPDGTITLKVDAIYGFTPEQAIAATVGVDLNTGEAIRKLLDKLNTELCNAGCVVECETREERQRLIDAVKDKYAQAIVAMVGARDTMGLWPEWEQVLFANVSDEVAQDNLNECVHELLDKAATVGRGNLTAEQVREAIMSADRWRKPMGDTGMTNTHLIIRDDGWQAIADELNATVGVGTCELINAADDLGEGTSSCMCSKCGYTALDDWWDEFKHCPNCGAKVVSE